MANTTTSQIKIGLSPSISRLVFVLITNIVYFIPIIIRANNNSQYFLTSDEITWNLDKRIIKGKLNIIENNRFSLFDTKGIRKDCIVPDDNYVIIDCQFEAKIGMYEVRKNDTNEFQAKNGVFMACYNIKNEIVEVLNVNTGEGSKMSAFPLTEPMIKKKNISYIKFSIPKEGLYSEPIITNWGNYTIKDKNKREYFSRIFDDGIINLKYFVRKVNEGDDTNRLQCAANLAYWGKTLYIPNNVYELSKPLKLFYFQNVEMNNHAILYAGPKFNGSEYTNSLIEYDCGAARIQIYKGADRYTMWVPNENNPRLLHVTEQTSIKGGCLNGMGIANCIQISHARGGSIENISLRNPKSYGLRVSGSQEMKINKCTCINTIESSKKNTAFSINSPDNIISECVAIDTNIGFTLAPYTIASSLHHWIGMINGKYEGSVSFRVNSNGTVLTGCYADTSETCYDIYSDNGICNMIGCIALSNPRMATITKVTGIRVSDNCKVNVIGGSFDLRTSPGYENNIMYVNGKDKVNTLLNNLLDK